MPSLGSWVCMTLFVIILIEAPTPAYAYLDPGTGSIMLQAILGTIAGSLVIGKLYWQKIKNFFSDTKQDSNSDKAIEEKTANTK